MLWKDHFLKDLSLLQFVDIGCVLSALDNLAVQLDKYPIIGVMLNCGLVVWLDRPSAVKAETASGIFVALRAWFKKSHFSKQ